MTAATAERADPRAHLRADWATITPLPPVFPFAWAVAHGRDRHGLWHAFEIAGVRQRLRWLPPGAFDMGSPDDEPERENAETLHRVVLRQGFWIADTAVSQQLWMAVVGGENPSRFKDDPHCPVEKVSWNDIQQQFLPALNAQVPGLAAWLPSEAEWEFACREAGRAKGPFSFGDQLTTDQANYDGNHPMPCGAKGIDRNKTVPVDQMPRNAYGLSSMHGNVWEWVQDKYAPYPNAELVLDGRSSAPEGPEGSALRVLRGGTWFNFARFCRSALRIAGVPGERGGDFGFRLARGPLPEAGWAEPRGGGAARVGLGGQDARRADDGASAPPAARPRGRRGA